MAGLASLARHSRETSDGKTWAGMEGHRQGMFAVHKWCGNHEDGRDDSPPRASLRSRGGRREEETREEERERGSARFRELELRSDGGLVVAARCGARLASPASEAGIGGEAEATRRQPAPGSPPRAEEASRLELRRGGVVLLGLVLVVVRWRQQRLRELAEQ